MRARGNRGEDMAAAYIESVGGEILARNHGIRGGEVDLIFRDADTIVFCEVKLRSGERFGTPAEAVTITKQKRVCRAALDYAYKKNCIDEKLRFDIIEVVNGKINHIKNAFEFTGEE